MTNDLITWCALILVALFLLAAVVSTIDAARKPAKSHTESRCPAAHPPAGQQPTFPPPLKSGKDESPWDYVRRAWNGGPWLFQCLTCGDKAISHHLFDHPPVHHCHKQKAAH